MVRGGRDPVAPDGPGAAVAGGERLVDHTQRRQRQHRGGDQRERSLLGVARSAGVGPGAAVDAAAPTVVAAGQRLGTVRLEQREDRGQHQQHEQHAQDLEEVAGLGVRVDGGLATVAEPVLELFAGLAGDEAGDAGQDREGRERPAQAEAGAGCERVGHGEERGEGCEHHDRVDDEDVDGQAVEEVEHGGSSRRCGWGQGGSGGGDAEEMTDGPGGRHREAAFHDVALDRRERRRAGQGGAGPAGRRQPETCAIRGSCRGRGGVGTAGRRTASQVPWQQSNTSKIIERLVFRHGSPARHPA